MICIVSNIISPFTGYSTLVPLLALPDQRNSLIWAIVIRWSAATSKGRWERIMPNADEGRRGQKKVILYGQPLWTAPSISPTGN